MKSGGVTRFDVCTAEMLTLTLVMSTSLTLQQFSSRSWREMQGKLPALFRLKRRIGGTAVQISYRWVLIMLSMLLPSRHPFRTRL